MTHGSGSHEEGTAEGKEPSQVCGAPRPGVQTCPQCSVSTWSRGLPQVGHILKLRHTTRHPLQKGSLIGHLLREECSSRGPSPHPAGQRRGSPPSGRQVMRSALPLTGTSPEAASGILAPPPSLQGQLGSGQAGQKTSNP